MRDDDIDQMVGRRVQAEMILQGVTQKDLAPKVDLRQNTLSEKLNGKSRFTAAQLWRVAVVLKKPVDWFLPERELEVSA